MLYGVGIAIVNGGSLVIHYLIVATYKNKNEFMVCIWDHSWKTQLHLENWRA